MKRKYDDFNTWHKNITKSMLNAHRVIKINCYKMKKKGISTSGIALFFVIVFLGGYFIGTNVFALEPIFAANPIDGNSSNNIQEMTRQGGYVTLSSKQAGQAGPIENDSIDNSGNEIGQVLLPGRTMKQDDNGNPIIEVEDPASLVFLEKMAKVEKMPEMRDIDKQAIELARAYDGAKGAPKPFIEANNGRINFYFGTMVPRIVCKPLRMTDIELEPAERVTGLNIADGARWAVSTSTSGNKEWLITHIIVKPRIPDISTNLLIHTDRRTYAIELVSVSEGQYMPFVGFLYPDSPPKIGADDSGEWDKLLKEYDLADNYISAKSAAYEQGIFGNDPKDINLNYTIKVTRGSNVAWKPKHVYDLGGKTYIVMSDGMKFSEAPTLFEKKDKTEKLLNYRVKDNVYIVDRLFDLAIMTAGKDRVAITRKTPINASN